MRKRTKKILLVSTITLVALYALPCIYVAVRSIDIDPPDDSDLKVESVVIADEDNAYIYYMEAAQSIDKEQALQIAKDPESNEDAIIAMALKILPVIEAGNRCDRYIPPSPKLLTDWAPMGQMSHLFEILKLHSELMHERGDHENSARSTLTSWKLAHRTCEGAKSTVDCLFAMSVGAITLNQMESLSLEESISSDILERLSSVIEEHVDWRTGLSNVMKYEYQVLSNHIGKILSDDLNSEALSGKKYGGKLSPFLLPEKTKVNYLFQPNRTRQELAGITRSSIREIQELADKGRLEKSWSDDWEKPSKWNLMSRPNAFGRILVSMVAASPKSTGNRSIKVFTYKQPVTQLIIAIRRYELDRGSLPDSLEQLIPNYIQTLPEHRKGKFRYEYSRETRTLSYWMKGNKEDTLISFKQEQN